MIQYISLVLFFTGFGTINSLIINCTNSVEKCSPVTLNCSKPHEHYECGSPCQTECSTLNKPCLINNVKCTEACYCDKGYARDVKGICIPIEKCPPVKLNCTKPNEHYACGSACQTKCSTLGEVCPIINIRCNDACYCNEGYARDKNGVCIPIEKCPPKLNCTQPNEHYECGSACQTQCSTLGQVCPIQNIKCNDACYCDKGFARDVNGVCIPIEKCPPPKINCTKPNEHYECGSACQTECSTLGQDCPIINIRCNDACYCNKGFARDSNGVCIPIAKCPPLKINCTKPNEHYECGSACQTQCSTLREPCLINNIKCTEACYCNNGYARDKSGVCIPIEKCPPKINCTNPNEHYECGSACQTKCWTVGQPCNIYTYVCVDACFCNEGYARDYNGVCVPIEKCPPPKINCTNPHEHYDCGSACQTECSTLGQECSIINKKCNDACYCDDGYARNEKGVCIPIRDCQLSKEKQN